MSHARRSVLEKKIQRDIEADLGAEPDLLLLRNSVGKATYFSEADGKEYHVPYGLGEGSPDLVAILRVSIHGVIAGVWFCLEVKPPEGELEHEQVKCHAVWSRFGAVIETVRSVADARGALERARRHFNQRAAA